MVDCARFKPEVFGSLPVSVLCLMLVIVSISFPFWLTKGGADTVSDTSETTTPPTFMSDVSYGLFYGKKSRTRGGTCTRTLRWVCSSGVCMLSCGRTAHDRKEDIENILGGSNYTSATGDEHFCPPCAGTAEEAGFGKSQDQNPFLSILADLSDTTVSSDTTASSDTTTPVTFDDPSPHMVRQGMIITTQVFLVVGLLFTFINIFFTVLNIAHNPVSAIVGIDGLVAWNIIAGLMYLFVLIIWGSEYNIKLRKNLCISDTLRPGIEFDSHSTIGWCCLLLICPMFLHLGTGSLFAWRQWKRYYSKQSKQAKEMRINVQDPTQGGTDILF